MSGPAYIWGCEHLNGQVLPLGSHLSLQAHVRVHPTFTSNDTQNALLTYGHKSKNPRKATNDNCCDIQWGGGHFVRPTNCGYDPCLVLHQIDLGGWLFSGLSASDGDKPSSNPLALLFRVGDPDDRLDRALWLMEG